VEKRICSECGLEETNILRGAEAHDYDSRNKCVECGTRIVATEGLLYRYSEKYEGYEVCGSEGTLPEDVVIAPFYERDPVVGIVSLGTNAVKSISIPDYTKNEEWWNALTHFLGALFGVVALVLNLIVTYKKDTAPILTGVFYAFTIILMYTISGIYHFLPVSDTKRLWRVIDHCTIYLLIIGTYTPIVLVGVRALSPLWGWLIFGIEVGVGLFAILLNILDLKKYSAVSMGCYILMGWAIVLNLRLGIEALTPTGFALVLAGGIVYTIGAILYGVGKKRRYFHTIFHVFSVLATILQYLGVFLYVLK
jgi:hemolysin III